MVHLQIRLQVLKSTRNKTPHIDLEDKYKTNAVFYTTVDPSTTKEETFYSDLCRCFPSTPQKVNKYIYINHLYDCNTNITTTVNNRVYKDIQ